MPSEHSSEKKSRWNFLRNRKLPDLATVTAFVRRNKWRLAALLLIPLVIWLLLPSQVPPDESAPSSDLSDYCRELEQTLEELLSKVEGVGKCRVMITFSDAGQTVYACDESSSGSGDVHTSESRKYVLVSSRSDGLVLKVETPSVCGVAVVCSGGNSTRVKTDVTEILCRTLNLPADRISVKQYQS